MKRLIQILYLPEMTQLPVMKCVFTELAGAFLDHGCTVQLIQNFNDLEDGGLMFLHDEAGEYKHNQALYERIALRCPTTVFICWYWRDLAFRPFERMLYTGEYYLYLHRKRAELADYAYMTHPLFVPLKLRADDPPEKIGLYSRYVVRDYCFMGGGYKMDWVPSEFTGIYHRVVWDNYVTYEVRRQIYLTSLFAFGFQSDENIRTGHLSQRIFEGMAYGCIVLCNNELASTFTDGVVVYVSSKEDLIEKMTYYKAHPTEVAKKQQAGYEWVKRQGTNRSSATLLLDKVYDVFGERFSTSPTDTRPVVSVNIMGGLGNQLFQIAAAYAYAKRERGVLQLLYKTENGRRSLYWDTLLEKMTPYLVSSLPSSPLVQWYESLPTMHTLLPPLTQPGLYLNGYMQTSRYFDDATADLRRLFQPSAALLSSIAATYQTLLHQKERVVVIHCRQTDYVTHREFHGPLDGAYYKKAVARIGVENPLFLLCGDDPLFWKDIRDSIPEVLAGEHLILHDETDVNTFVLLQQFENFIMSNSTFIWWCVWMAAAKRVIVPTTWFGPAGPTPYEDIYEASWIRI